MRMTEEEKEYLKAAMIITDYDRGDRIRCTNTVNYFYDQGISIEKVPEHLGNPDFLKIADVIAVTPTFRAKVESINDANKKQQAEILDLQIFKQNSELQMNNLINEVRKFTNQVIKYQTVLEDTRNSLHAISAEFNDFKHKVCSSSSFNCETIGITLTSEPDLDGLNNIIT